MKEEICQAPQELVNSAANEVKKIVETNSPSVEARKEMAKLKETVIKLTREAIQNGSVAHLPSRLRPKTRGN